VPIREQTALNAICPYYTMYPLDFPLGVIKRLARKAVLRATVTVTAAIPNPTRPGIETQSGRRLTGFVAEGSKLGLEDVPRVLVVLDDEEARTPRFGSHGENLSTPAATSPSTRPAVPLYLRICLAGWARDPQVSEDELEDATELDLGSRSSRDGLQKGASARHCPSSLHQRFLNCIEPIREKVRVAVHDSKRGPAGRDWLARERLPAGPVAVGDSADEDGL
jgi:hypothetical protein